MTKRVHVGGTPDGASSWDDENWDWETTEVVFHGFVDLPMTRGVDCAMSAEFTSVGRRWCVGIYPGGTHGAREGYISVKLSNMSHGGFMVGYSFSIKGECYKEIRHFEQKSEYFHPRDAEYIHDFARRSKVLDSLVSGALVVEVRLERFEPRAFVPENPLYKNILRKFMDEESADVIFEVVEDEQRKRAQKKAKATATFHAHGIFLQDSAPVLADLCKSSGGDAMALVTITDVKPAIFRHMLYHLYGGKLSDEELKENAKDLIDAADKYGIVHLKLEAEACYVEHTEITADNVMENLLYADSKNCALLKEAVMDFMLENRKDVMKKASLKDAPAGLLADILAAVGRMYDDSDDDSDDDGDDTDRNYLDMRVSKLRKELHERGLDVDGSRETMIGALKQNDSRKVRAGE